MSLDLVRMWELEWPYLALLGLALFSLIPAAFPARHRAKLTALVAALGFLLCAQGFYYQADLGVAAAMDLLVFDRFGNLLSALMCLTGFVTVLVSYAYWNSQAETIPEYYTLLLFSVFGMTTMVFTTQLLVFVLGLEILSLSLYALVGFRRYDPRSGEAAFKYFLLGSVATAFLLLGVAMLYGATGTMDLAKLPASLSDPALQPIYQLSALLILLGFAFKVAAVPFHFWAPDAYDGAPMPVTGFMAAGVKIAAFGALLRVMQAWAPSVSLPWQKWIVMLAFATMLIGNLVALRQQHLKRLMAYSSIAHAGYLLLGFAALVAGGFRPEAISPILSYLAVYSLMTLGVFAVLTLLSSRGVEVNHLNDLDGLADRHPAVAAALSVFLISLAGVPPTAGFLAKYYLFSQAIEVGLYPLAIAGILASAISLYYYLGPIVRMYFHHREKVLEVPPVNPAFKLLLALLVVGVFYLGLFPGKMVELSRSAELFPAKPAGASGYSQK